MSLPDHHDAEPRIAFYAPMKPPDHPTPSGDRQIARLTLEALARAGFLPGTVSELRLLDMDGDLRRQHALAKASHDEARRLVEQLRDNPPALWFTYHCYYKAPDLVGPRVSEALGIPYAISEPSISPKRREGDWALFAAASEAAIACADRLFWTTGRDRPALEEAGFAKRMKQLPAFVAEGSPPKRRAAHTPLRLLAVAMMRSGDKIESYRRLANALKLLSDDWILTIVGDGEAADEVHAMFAPFKDRTLFRGQLDDPAAMRAAYEAADLLVWPGVGEGVGMTYLEAQAAGLPVIAENHAAQRDIIAAPLAPVRNARAFADAIKRGAREREVLSGQARDHIVQKHSVSSAARTLRDQLMPLVS